MTIPELAVMGFVIGLTGALAPGPTLIATIRSSLYIGWSGGPRVTLGHIIAELGIIILIAAGISRLPESFTPYIAWGGGCALIIFGGLTLAGARDASISCLSGEKNQNRPVLAGLMTSISNPYFWIWWFSVGSALLYSSLAAGITGLLAFIGGHWSADLLWFTLVSVSIHRSKRVLTDAMYKSILYLCGALLVIFGLWFISTTIW